MQAAVLAVDLAGTLHLFLLNILDEPLSGVVLKEQVIPIRGFSGRTGSLLVSASGLQGQREAERGALPLPAIHPHLATV